MARVVFHFISLYCTLLTDQASPVGFGLAGPSCDCCLPNVLECRSDRSFGKQQPEIQVVLHIACVFDTAFVLRLGSLFKNCLIYCI